MLPRSLLLLALPALLVGCNPPADNADEPPAPPAPPSAEAGAPPAEPPTGEPAPGGETPAGDLSPEEKKLAELEAKFEGSPSDAKLKAQVVEAAYQAGHTMMLNPDLPPRVKYRGALKHLRRALELDPKHEGAAKDRKQIEDIYTMMGRPVPE